MPIETRRAHVRADDAGRDNATRDNITGDNTRKDNTKDILQANVEILQELVGINIIVRELPDKIVD